MSTPAGSLLSNVPDRMDDELFETLARSGPTRIERIVSVGQASPPGFWYDEAWDEFVVVIAGAAKLDVDGESTRTLRAGDWVFLPAHTRHRVAWTDPDRATVWLAVHTGEPADA